MSSKRKPGRPKGAFGYDDGKHLDSVADLVASMKAKSAHAAMCTVIKREYPYADQSYRDSVVRRFQRKWRTTSEQRLLAARERLTEGKALSLDGAVSKKLPVYTQPSDHTGSVASVPKRSLGSVFEALSLRAAEEKAISESWEQVERAMSPQSLAALELATSAASRAQAIFDSPKFAEVFGQIETYQERVQIMMAQSSAFEQIRALNERLDRSNPFWLFEK